VPAAYLMVAAVLGVFAVGYVAMARHVTNAGAFYSYIARGLGRPAGVAAAFVALTAYALLQASIFGLFGVATATALAGLAGVSVSWWVCALGGWVLVAVLGVRPVDVSGRLLAILLIAEVAVVVVFDAVLVGHPGVWPPSITPLDPTQLFTVAGGALLVGGIAGSAGFEASTVFAEEARDPRRTVPRATYIAVAVTGILYGLSAWAMTVATGVSGIVPAARQHEEDLFFALAAQHLPAVVVDVGRLLLLTSVFAALLAFHNTVARYVFALGRERVLFAFFGRTGRRTAAPVRGSAVQSGVALVVIVVFAAAGWDPIRHLYFWTGIGGGLGLLILMTAVSVAVVAFFARDRHGEPFYRTTLAPVVAGLVLAVILAATIAGLGDLLQVDPNSPVRWAFPLGYAAVAVAGLGWAVALKLWRPNIYATVGLGAQALVAGTCHHPPVQAGVSELVEPAVEEAHR